MNTPQHIFISQSTVRTWFNILKSPSTILTRKPFCGRCILLFSLYIKSVVSGVADWLWVIHDSNTHSLVPVSRLVPYRNHLALVCWNRTKFKRRTDHILWPTMFCPTYAVLWVAHDNLVSWINTTTKSIDLHLQILDGFEVVRVIGIPLFCLKFPHIFNQTVVLGN